MKKKIFSLAFAACFFMAFSISADKAYAGKPTIAGGCKKCHTGKADAIRGKLKTVSTDFQTLQIEVGKLIWIVQYSDKTEVIQGDKKDTSAAIAKLPKNKEILVTFTGAADSPMAVDIAVKQPYKVPPEQLLTIDELAKLLEIGPENGKYTLIDSRPVGAYLDGHIPTALSLPYGAFDKKYQKILPKDKERLVIFYCGGFT